MLYRLVTGYRSGNEPNQEILSDYMLVAELSPSVTSFVDTVLLMDVGETLSTVENREPPAGLRHISHINSTGMLVGVTRNKVHFSEDMQPANWPAFEDWTLPDNIVNMVTLDTRVFVSTDGKPFVIDGDVKCGTREERVITDCDTSMPDISCGFSHSAIATPFGMVYSSADGVVLLDGEAKITILTANFYDTESWRRLRPETARFAFWRGTLFCVTEAISLVMSLEAKNLGDNEFGVMATISDKPADMWVNGNGELLMLENDVIYQWDASNKLRPYKWRSRPIRNHGGRYSPTSARIAANKMTAVTLKPEHQMEDTIVVHDDRWFRLPRRGRHLSYQVGLEGTSVVEYLQFGEMISTLTDEQQWKAANE
jgi:hypothetical protein